MRVKCLCNCARWMLHCAGSGEAAYLLLMLILLLRFFVRLQFPFCVFNVCSTRNSLCLYIVLRVCVILCVYCSATATGYRSICSE
jgi:hypothetical protein